MVDAELVIDVDPLTKHVCRIFELIRWLLNKEPSAGQETLRLLCFDCLVVDNDNVMSKTLDKRYWVRDPFPCSSGTECS